jgi:type VI secretion system FHA domain protein
MNLTLEVISANGSSMGGARRKVFSEAGGRIGRGADCDWVLPSPDKYVSRHHASVLFKYGQFYVKAEGENSVAVNDPNTLLASGTPSPLKQGDRVFIDEYEILVSLPKEVVRPPLIVGDPFADEPGEEALIPAGGALGDENLDPLSQLLGGPSQSSPNEPRFRGPPAGDVLSDSFVPAPIQSPRVTAPAIPRGAPVPPPRDDAPLPSGGGGTVIPTDPDAWNKTTYGFNSIQRPVEAPPPPRPQARPEAAPQVSAPPREAARQAPSPRPPSPPSPPLRPAASRPVTAPPPQPPPRPVANRPATPPPPQPTPTPTPVGRTPPAPIGSPAASGAAPRGAAFDVDAMLAAAGVDPQNVSPEMAATLGEILMVVVQGTIDALRARDEVKSQFRLAVTRVRTTDNNPLTFAVDAADAMNSLLSRRNAAFLAPVEAFQRAFDDIRGHQVALLAGMRAGFESLMNRLDPEQLQEDFDKQAKHGGLLSAVGKPKYWDQYKDYFAGLQGDREDAFRRLFGEEFALAYEKQVELIKRSRGIKNR